MAFEPLTGQHLVETSTSHKGQGHTCFMQALAKAYPAAVKIRLVQDNLNTPSPSSFYQHLPAQQALQLANRFEWIYTPRKPPGSIWSSRVAGDGTLRLESHLPQLDLQQYTGGFLSSD